MQAFVRLAAALLILVVAGSSFAQLPVAIDPEAMIERIVAVDEKQRSEVRDLVLDADYIEGELNDDGLFEEKVRFVKKVYLRFLPDTTLLHQEFLEYYKDGKLQDEGKRDKEASEREKKRKKRKGRDVSSSILDPFYSDQRDNYNLTYLGVSEESIDDFVCHHFRVDAINENDRLINGDFYFDAESFHLVRADFSPAKLVKKLMFKLNELNMSMSYTPTPEGYWVPRQFDIQGKGKAMFLIGVKFSGTEYYRNPVVNSGIDDKLFEVTDGK